MSNAFEIGIRLLPEQHGHGYRTQAQAQLADYLLASYPVNRVQASTDVTNLGEQRSLEQSGFTGKALCGAPNGDTASFTTWFSTPDSATALGPPADPGGRRSVYGDDLCRQVVDAQTTQRLAPQSLRAQDPDQLAFLRRRHRQGRAAQLRRLPSPVARVAAEA
jgi:hypothetical protein